MVAACAAGFAVAQPLVVSDPPGDAVIRRTDPNNDGPINPNTQRLPDLVEMRLGKFAPVTPVTDLFAGSWSASGGFLRFDVVVLGVINPPGPLGFDDISPAYNPFAYGPNPIYGWVELDVDADENTGGELIAPHYRYLGNVGRFGGMPHEPRYTGRAAEDMTAFDNNILTPPFVEKSGEEFHIAFLGEKIQAVAVKVEKPGGIPAIFEAGETWVIEGPLFHRAHGFEDFAFQCVTGQGSYLPHVFIQFAHDLNSDRTTISLVYPLTNAACAAMAGPSTPVQPNNGCDDDQNSIEEALTDLAFSATNASPGDRLNPNFQLLAGWQFKTPANYQDPALWRIAALVGSAYGTQQSDGARYVWTDVWPNPRFGDFDGNCILNAADTAKFNAYVHSHDGQSGFDDDGNALNGSIQLHLFANGFSTYDTNYDGFVQAGDLVVPGDMDMNQTLNINDVVDFVQALLNPQVYESTHGGAKPAWRGDLNCDDRLDGLDVQIFINLILAGA